MDEHVDLNEYVNYYTEHCLEVLMNKVKDSQEETIEIPEAIALNDIRAIDYEQAVTTAQSITIGKGKQQLSESLFIHDITIQRFIGNLNAKKLWRLSVLLYTMIFKQPVGKISLSLMDEYLKLHRTLCQNIKISAIKFECKTNNKVKNVTISNTELITKILTSYLEMGKDIITPDNLRQYNISEITSIDKLVGKAINKRTLDYHFAIELEYFLTSYLNGKFTEKEKELILQILYLFGCYDSPATDTSTYRKLMSDGHKLLKSTPLLSMNGRFLPFTIIPNPEVTWLRKEYRELLTKCENEKNSSIHK